MSTTASNVSGLFCGEYDNAARILTISEGATECTSATADTVLKDVLVHEFAHILGFSDSYENGPAVTECTMRLTGIGGGVNGVPCIHEVEYVLLAYGYGFGGTAARNPGTAWWSWPIMTHFDVSPDSAVMEVLESQAFTVASVTYTGNTPQAYVVTTAPPGPETFSWRTADTLVAKPSSQVAAPRC